MPDYQKMYYILFNAATDALAALVAKQSYQAEAILTLAQQETERLYMEEEEK